MSLVALLGLLGALASVWIGDPPPAPRSDDHDVSDTGYTPRSMLERTRQALAVRGARPVVGDLARWGSGLATGLPWTLAGSHGDFELDASDYRYLYDRHKFTWLTERAVEVPVAQALVDQHAPDRRARDRQRALALPPAAALGRRQVRAGPGVLNRDVLDLGGLGRFDLIVAISTLEHVGLGRAARAIRQRHSAPSRCCAALLAPEGLLAITVPVGYNTAFDAALRSGQVPLHRAVALRAGPAGHAGARSLRPRSGRRLTTSCSIERVACCSGSSRPRRAEATAARALIAHDRASTPAPAARSPPRRSSVRRSTWCCRRSCRRRDRAG